MDFLKKFSATACAATPGSFPQHLQRMRIRAHS
jgi:hypothetical protein